MRMRILEYGIPIAIICIIGLLIGNGLLWYVRTYHNVEAISVLNKLAALVMSDAEYRAFLEEQIERCESDIAKIDAALAGSDNPASDAEIRPDGEIEAFSEKSDKAELPSEDSKR